MDAAPAPLLAPCCLTTCSQVGWGADGQADKARFLGTGLSAEGLEIRLSSSAKPVVSLCWGTGSAIEPRRLKQLMNCSKEALRELGLTFRSYRSNGQRLVEVRYTEPVTQVPQVTQKSAPKSCVPCVPCGTASQERPCEPDLEPL